jgi:hypothetical protein
MWGRGTGERNGENFFAIRGQRRAARGVVQNWTSIEETTAFTWQRILGIELTPQTVTERREKKLKQSRINCNYIDKTY